MDGVAVGRGAVHGTYLSVRLSAGGELAQMATPLFVLFLCGDKAVGIAIMPRFRETLCAFRYAVIVRQHKSGRAYERCGAAVRQANCRSHDVVEPALSNTEAVKRSDLSHW
jgi:hypothetical protein